MLDAKNISMMTLTPCLSHVPKNCKVLLRKKKMFQNMLQKMYGASEEKTSSID